MKPISLSVLVFGLMLTMASAKDDAAIEEMKKFEGTWQLSSAITDGKESADETVKQIRVVIKAGKHTVYFGDTVVAKEISFAVDPTQTPKTTVDTLPDGKVIKGIYKLDGDTLTSCVGGIDKERPSEFSSKPGTGHTLRIFKRRVDPAEESKKFEGTWLLTTAELAEMKWPEELLKTMKLTMKEANYTVKIGERLDQGTWKIDTVQCPRAIDILGTEGPNKGKTILGIYEFTDDGLRICYDLGGKNRPSEFKTKLETPLFLVTYKREMP